MSDKKLDKDPTILDLHIEQTRQAIILDRLSEDTKEIKEVLVGDNKRHGLVMDVDRLKQSRAFVNAILWVFFTAILGVTATAVYATFTK